MATEAQTDNVARVRSADGTPIAYWTTGEGPPLLLVHGTAGDHARWRPLLPHLQPHATVHALDRRGRGASGDAPRYALERECEDVAAVVDEVARVSGGPVDLLGHSYGGTCALGAASLTANVRRLVIYEAAGRASLAAVPAGLVARLEALVARDEREAAVESVFRELLGCPEEEVAAVRAAPSWPARVAAAHTIPRELGVDASGVFAPDRTSRVTAPALLVAGAESQAPAREDVDALAAWLPAARVWVIDGQEHLADLLVPDAFAEGVLAFLR